MCAVQKNISFPTLHICVGSLINLICTLVSQFLSTNNMDIKTSFFHVVIYLLASICPTHIVAQDSSLVNDLKRQLQRYEAEKIHGGKKGVVQSDSSKILILNRLARANWSSNPNQALTYAREIEDLSKQLDYKKGLGLAYSLSGIAYWLQGNYPNALNEMQKGLKLAEEQGNKSAISAQYIPQNYTRRMIVG